MIYGERFVRFSASRTGALLNSCHLKQASGCFFSLDFQELVTRAERRGNEAPTERFSSARESTRPQLLKNRLRRASLSGKMEVYNGMLRPWLEKPDAMLGHAA
jgi:hypothetical protein